MMYKSGINLESGAIQFIKKNESITLFSAYLKLEELKKINERKNIKRIIVRWEIQDLCLEVSDLSLYEYCEENKITLYRNTRIHLKAFWNNEKSVVFGSANVTGKGLGEIGNYNYELNGLINAISFEDINYFEKIIATSEYVSESLYLKIKSMVEDVKLPVVDYPVLDTIKKEDDYFLLSQLPMSKDFETLFKVYSTKTGSDLLEENCAAHDIALYELTLGMTQSELKSALKDKFNQHSFIQAFKRAIKDSINERYPERNGSMQFTKVKIWFQKNTTTVPTPRTYELTTYVKILYEWIQYFDSEYTWSRPGSHSQVIQWNG